MHDNKYLVETICEKLGSGVSLILASIVNIQGSSPRHQGTKMVIDTQGHHYGTIGGSLMEATAIKEAAEALDGFAVDGDSYIVIVTRGHAFDRVVLEQSLRTDAGYIGMISSRRKRDAIYASLTAEGVRREALERVHSPIGLPIGGETPEEIAVSIVAELISERYKKKA